MYYNIDEWLFINICRIISTINVINHLVLKTRLCSLHYNNKCYYYEKNHNGGIEMYRIITDSECDLPVEFLKTNNVDAIYFHTEIEGQELVNDFGKSYPLTKFYEQIKAGVLPTTTQVNIGEYTEFFKKYVEKDIPIVYVGFSGGLSGSMSSARQAREIILEDNPHAQIRIVDTLAASGGEGRLVLEAVRLQKSGASLDELVKWFDQNKLRLQQWFTVDNLTYLYHGGRISRASATLGTLLKVKPLLDVDPSGKLRFVSKIRTRKRSLITLAEKVVSAMKNDLDQSIIITTSGDWEAADFVKQHILNRVSNADVQINPIGMTISSHTGFGCVAVFVMGTENRK